MQQRLCTVTSPRLLERSLLLEGNLQVFVADAMAVERIDGVLCFLLRCHIDEAITLRNKPEIRTGKFA